MSRTIIIGYGNPLCGDDAVGYYAARKLSELVKSEDITIHTYHQLTPELAADISRYDKAVFIDASVGGTPGTITTAQIDPTHIPNRTYSHQLDPESVLTCSQALYGRVPAAYLVTIDAGSFGYMEDLSGPVKAGLSDLIDAVLEIIEYKETKVIS